MQLEWIRSSQRPMIVAGGGVIYSEATETLSRFASQSRIPVGETQAGKGSLRFDHPQNLGAIGVTGTPGAMSPRARLTWSSGLAPGTAISRRRKRRHFRIRACVSLT